MFETAPVQSPETTHEKKPLSFDEALKVALNIGDESQEQEAALMEFFNRPDTSFYQKTIIIHSVIEDLAQFNVDSSSPEYHSVQFLLEELSAKESNFFLKGLMRSFLEESYREPSPQDMKKVLLDNWDEITFQTTEQTIIQGEYVRFPLGRKVFSVDELTSEEIEKAAKTILREDYDFFSPHWFGSIARREKYRLPENSQNQPLERPHERSEQYQNSFGETLFSRISSEYIAVYDELGNIVSIQKSRDDNQPISIDQVVLPYANEKTAGSIEYLTKTYQAMMSLRVREFLDDKLGIDLAALPLAAQVYLLNFLSQASESDVDATASFIHKGTPSRGTTEHRLITFLSIGQGGLEMGSKILSIERNFSTEITDQIFAKYAELVNASENARQYLLDHRSVRTPYDEEIARKIADRLLSRGKDLLVEFASKSEHGDAEIEPSQLIERIEQTTVAIEQFKSLFQYSHQYADKEFSFEDFAGVELSLITGKEIPEADRYRMRAVYLANYPETDYPTEFREALINGFDKALEQETTQWHILKKDDAIIAFLRFDHPEAGPTHFGSFNVAPEFQQSKIGEALYRTAFDREQAKQPEMPIEAECVPKRRITQFYLAQGFVGTGSAEYPGMTLLRIVLDPCIQSITQGMTPDAIAALPVEQVRVMKTAPAQPDLSPLNQGYVLTRYEFDRSGNVVYCVYERISDVATP